METDVIVLPNYTGYLPGEKAAVVFNSESRSMFETPASEPFPVTLGKKTFNIVPWGETNNLPQQIIEKAQLSPDLSTGLLFNILATYGDSVIPCRYEYDAKEKKRHTIPVYNDQEINDFFEQNDINGYLIEQITDLSFFYNVFPEIILNRKSSAQRKIVELNHKEAAFSRWGEMDEKSGKIENHFYHPDWEYGSQMNTDAERTPVLDSKRPLFDLLERIGRNPRRNGTMKDDRDFRYIIPVNFPTPGRTYYQRPYWYSIIESGWYDFAIKIPEFKKYILNNGMTIKYIIYLTDDYFPDIFAREGITDEEERKTRIAAEYTSFNTYLAGAKNAGKSMVSFCKTSPDGKKEYRVEIKALENTMKGGEYLEDSGEVSNMIAYSLGVHPSLIGAAPGKTGGSMSGSDKRELFTIKQALLKPIRDRLLKPLYLVKHINGWAKDIHFTIPNIELVTLDKNKSGIEEKI